MSSAAHHDDIQCIVIVLTCPHLYSIFLAYTTFSYTAASNICQHHKNCAMHDKNVIYTDAESHYVHICLPIAFDEQLTAGRCHWNPQYQQPLTWHLSLPYVQVSKCICSLDLFNKHQLFQKNHRMSTVAAGSDSGYMCMSPASHQQMRHA